MWLTWWIAEQSCIVATTSTAIWVKKLNINKRRKNNYKSLHVNDENASIVRNDLVEDNISMDKEDTLSKSFEREVIINGKKKKKDQRKRKRELCQQKRQNMKEVQKEQMKKKMEGVLWKMKITIINRKKKQIHKQHDEFLERK